MDGFGVAGYDWVGFFHVAVFAEHGAFEHVAVFLVEFATAYLALSFPTFRHQYSLLQRGVLRLKIVFSALKWIGNS